MTIWETHSGFSEFMARGIILLFTVLLLMSTTTAPAEAAPSSETARGGVDFTTFVYEGRDSVFDAAPPAPAEFYNPILAGSYPDPSLCRVGGDFYLINSSFAYFPGIPIFHSTDLVHWKQIGHVLDRPSQLNLDGLSTSQGIYAPDISFHDGTFYVITTSVYGIGNFYVTATNPAGPWSEPVPLKRVQGIDPAFFWDAASGKAYIVHNGEPPDNKPLYEGHRTIRLWEFDPKTGDVVGDGKIIVNGGTDITQKPSWIEGPHLFRRGEFYYLCAAEGGTGPKHSQVIFRSRAVWGPYEPYAENPILTQRNLDPNRAESISAVGHADLVETDSGDWWAVFLGMRGGNTLARETFLLPVTWENGWPHILPHSVPVPRTLPRPNLPASGMPTPPTTGSFVVRDDFNAPELNRAWNFLRTPREAWWSLTARPGAFRIEPRPVPLTSTDTKDFAANQNPSLIARRIQHSDFTVTTTLEINPSTPDNDAGIAALQHNRNYLFFGVRSVSGQAHQVFVERCANDTPVPKVIATAALPANLTRIELRLTGKANRYAFAYRVDGKAWVTLTENADGSMLDRGGSNFVGTYVGLYARTAPAATTDEATNPIVWADVPDPAIIRVGSMYYMSSTAMHLSPGLPIMKSTDLVNWKMVGYVYDTLGDNDALTLQNGKNAYGHGSWASSLRCHNGTFYASTFSAPTGKTHVYTTKDIENGPWTEASFSPALHDHSLFFEDDGRVFMIHGGGSIRLTELTADARAIKPGGVDQVIIPDASLVAGPNVGLPAEGSQIQKIHGKYYLSNITWPKGGMRTQLIFRSNTLTGPYEGRIALQDQGIAQGGLIDTPQGDWYALLFQDHGAVGRIPFLVPVRWEEGWPVLGVAGKAPKTLHLPARTVAWSGAAGMVASDEFERSPGQLALPLAWQWNHNPDNRHWSVTERPGFLRLTTGRVDTDLLSARNTLTQRTFGPQSSGTVALDVSRMKDGDAAGLAVLQKKYGFVGVKRVGDARSIVVVTVDSDSPVEVPGVPLADDQNTVFLKVGCDFQNRSDKAYFFYSLDGSQWLPLGKPLQMLYTIPQFIGYRFALFNYATKTPGGFVDFDYFRLTDTSK